jgi:hypothetical protein
MVSGALRAVGLSSLSRRKGRLLSSKRIGEGAGGFVVEEEGGCWLAAAFWLEAGFGLEEGGDCWP